MKLAQPLSKILVLLTCFTLSLSVFAHPGHDHNAASSFALHGLLVASLLLACGAFLKYLNRAKKCPAEPR